MSSHTGRDSLFEPPQYTLLCGTVAVAALVLGGDGEIEIVGADGTAKEAVVHPHTVVLSFLVVLLYRSEGRLRSLTLLGDSLADEDFRQLRLWLRWRPAAATSV